ncbi:SRPBCC domain-containing protein [Kitasatospora sp. MMS16-BH015]|uniref:SRPBCC domain-containing protein n=1 Tax=Kitasatospora sp. MMS16-BH015 TaxID=2018025 RepID=UPI000CF2C5B6|nr:SRPBCC domain-containing protein [Kitasatospora sp. MMS16-BH015]
MEHEVVVPLSAEVVLKALREPELLARCVPGLSTDAVDGQELTGRLRLRLGSSTITYRGTLSLIEGREGVLTVLAEGQEARGEGEVTATLRIAAEAADPEGAVLRFTGDLSATGRLAEYEETALATAGRRLLDRFVSALAVETGEVEPPSATVLYLEDHAGFGGDLDDDLSDLIAFSDGPGEPGDPGESEAAAAAVEPPALPEPAEELPYVFQAVPAAAEAGGEGPVRRSIVGRSAEEVDHAPPRGRYAPAPPARSARARAATRWVGPETVPAHQGPLGGVPAMPWVIGGGVALLGGAVVLVRALRRR